MAFIGFGKIDKNIIPLILGCVFCLLNRILNSAFGNYLLSNVILTNIFISLANTLIIIPYLVYKCISKKNDKIKKNEENNDDNNEITKKESDKNMTQDQEDEEKKLEYIYNENEDIENVPGKLKFIILIALIFFVNYYLFIHTIQVKSNTWTMFIVFTSIFYYLIFKSKLYRHHYLSIGLILIFGIIIDIVEENIQNDTKNKENAINFCLSILRVILLSLIYVLIKYTMEKKYVSPYVLGMFIGLINLVLFIIFGILDHFFIRINEDIVKYFQNFDTNELFVVLGLMVTQLGLYTSLFFIDKNESPCHIFIVFVFGQFGYIFFKFPDMSGGTIAIIVIFLILILFFSLVFNEIIELRFLGFAYNTKRNITARGEIEVGNTMLLNNNASDGRSSNTIEMSDKDSNTEENN